MAAFVDEDMHNLHINTLVFIVTIANCEEFSMFPNFFCKKKGRPSSRNDGFVYFMFWNSVLGVTARTSFLVLVEFEDSSLSPCFQESEL